MTTPKTAPLLLKAADYSEATPFSLDAPVQGANGGRYHTISANGKPIALLFKDCLVKPCVNGSGRPFLVADHEECKELMTVLEAVRQRCGGLLGADMTGKAFLPLMAESKSLIKRPPSMFLNLVAKMGPLRDLEKKEVDYKEVVNKPCKMALVIHLSSVWEKDGAYSLQPRVSQMVLQEVVPAFQVDQMDLGEVDLSELL